jgi:hypothetical protein
MRILLYLAVSMKRAAATNVQEVRRSGGTPPLEEVLNGLRRIAS